MPPKDARVVFASIGWWTRVADDLSLHVYSPAFLLEERRDGSIVILRGLKREVLPKSESRPIRRRSRPFSAKEIDPASCWIPRRFSRPTGVGLRRSIGGTGRRGDGARHLAASRDNDRVDLRPSRHGWSPRRRQKWTIAKEEIRNPRADSRRVHFRRSRESTDAKGRRLADHLRVGCRRSSKKMPELSRGNRKALFEDLAHDARKPGRRHPVQSKPSCSPGRADPMSSRNL